MPEITASQLARLEMAVRLLLQILDEVGVPLSGLPEVPPQTSRPGSGTPSLREVPPIQVAVVRFLASRPDGLATSEEVAAALGMNLAIFRGKMRGSGKHRHSVQDAYYARDWSIPEGGGPADRQRLYRLLPAGAAALERERANVPAPGSART